MPDPDDRRFPLNARRWPCLSFILAAFLLGACGGDTESVSAESDSAPVAAVSEKAAEPESEPEADCEPPSEFPAELPVPPCERTVGRIVRDPGSVTWIMVSSLGSDSEVKALFDEGLASGGFTVEEVTPPHPGSYVLEISGHGIGTGTIRFGSNDITAPTIRYDLEGDFGG